MAYTTHWQLNGKDIFITRSAINDGNYETTIRPANTTGITEAKDLNKLAQQMRKLGVSERNIMVQVEHVLEKIPSAHLVNW